MNEILITTVAISGISAIFAFLLTLADRTIGNYGEVSLIINEEKRIYCSRRVIPIIYFNRRKRYLSLLLVVVKVLVDIVRSGSWMAEDPFYLQKFLL